jgi:hypothetical protein
VCLACLSISARTGCENRHPFAWIFLRANRQIALNPVRDHCATSPNTLSNLNHGYRSGLDFSGSWRNRSGHTLRRSYDHCADVLSFWEVLVPGEYLRRKTIDRHITRIQRDSSGISAKRWKKRPLPDQELHGSSKLEMKSVIGREASSPIEECLSNM